MIRPRACRAAANASCSSIGVRAGSVRQTGSPVSPPPSSAYVSGSSGPLDTAVETLLAGQGVCRDYAHLVVAMCRALDMPARCVSVYAPGLWPMDFHAVAEVHVDGRWQVVDATYLAPRQSLVRIATGRDATDTAFLTTIAGDMQLLDVVVRASVDGELPRDSYADAVTLN
jgi:transglutaminase-like putative cysteine protease